MTISSEVRKAGPFDGNDVADTFPFSFKVFTDNDLMVVRADSLGAETVLTLGADYTVSLNPNQNESPGGSVVTTSPLAAGFKLVLTSKVGNLQPVDLTNQGGFYPSVINGALDRLTIMAQQLRVDVDRSAKLPITREEDADELLADIVLIADNMADVNTVSGNIANVIEVSGISGDVTTVAGVAPSVSVVAAIDSEVATVAGVASDIPAVAASAANIDAVAADLANVNTVAANIGNVNATGGDIANVNTVAVNIANINAAVADLPALAAKVSKTGDTMTGHLEVPAGASGAQVPQAQEVGELTSQQIGLAGQVAFFARNSAPSGWLKANGADVSRTAYAALFAAIGTTFGAGDGSTTFNLPDMRGMFQRGWDDGAGVDVGRAFGSYQADALQQGSFDIRRASDASTIDQANSGSVTSRTSVAGSLGTVTADAATGSLRRITIGSAPETRVKNIALLACIKT